MGIAIPQVITSDRASGAQVIDGSLKFDSDKSQHFKRTPGSAGNRKIFTWSAWLKRSSNLSAYNGLFFAGILFITIGYIIMSSGDTNSIQSLSIAPVMLFIGYIILIPASLIYRKG